MSKPIDRYEIILSNGFICTVLAPDAQTAKRVANETLGPGLQGLKVLPLISTLPKGA
jgi:hypothetical protein